ncbi:MAG: DUF3422 domain-containing protein [Neisseria sp.]|nr:DUF3422 domain-containing protein [Neisseria sp.]
MTESTRTDPINTLIADLRPHPWRQALYEELHSRPSPVIDGSCLILQFALLVSSEREVTGYLSSLCAQFGVAPPDHSSCFYQDFGPFELRWERHSEFFNFTFIFPTKNPFTLDVSTVLPSTWLTTIPGELVAATQLALVTAEPSSAQWRQWFEDHRISGSGVAEQAARVWTTFKLHRNSFGRMLVHNRSLTPYQSGRLVQRLLELETYRLMSLLALPMARQLSQDLRNVEDHLAALSQKISAMQIEWDERDLLHQVSELAADIEHRRSASNYRFSAAVAYHDLVNDRLTQLKEAPLEGMQSLNEFLQRRLTPGMKTVHATRARLENISNRIAQTTHLLQARVDLSVQEQNQSLLVSMNRRSQLQLRLQQTVEGLSVAAISYYLVGLLGYVFEGIHSMGAEFNSTMLKGLSAPIVVILVYWSIHSIKARIKQQVEKK